MTTLASSPAPLWWRRALHLVLVLPLAAVLWLVALGVADLRAGTPSAHLEVGALVAVVLAASAAAARHRGDGLGGTAGAPCLMALLAVATLLPSRWATSLALRLPPAAVGWIVHEVEDAPAGGHLVLPSGEGLAFEGTRPPGSALQPLQPGGEGRRVLRQLVVRNSQRVRSWVAQRAQASATPLSTATISHSSVRGGRGRSSARDNGSAGLRAPEPDRGAGALGPEELAQLRAGMDLRSGPPSLNEAGERLEVVDLRTGGCRQREHVKELGPLVLREEACPRKGSRQRTCHPLAGLAVDAGGEEEPGQHAQGIPDGLLTRPQAEEEVRSVAPAKDDIGVLDFGQDVAGVAQHEGEGVLGETHLLNIQHFI